MIKWEPIITQAAAIVASYDTGVTLRQLFYRLVAAELLPNTQTAYKTLSAKTAAARRAGTFPKLIDRTRTIHRDIFFDGVEDAKHWLAGIYRRDRTENQDMSIYVGVEKSGIVAQLEAWFGHLGIPVLALGGYSSQSYVDSVVADVDTQDRPAVLIYAGDFDPSGEDIDRDFLERTGCFEAACRIALNVEQVEQYNLPPLPGKATDPRAAGFVARHGRLVQVELDALPPDTLRDMYAEAIDNYWDMSTFEGVLRQEKTERAQLHG
jgi:hypothetical protein